MLKIRLSEGSLMAGMLMLFLLNKKSRRLIYGRKSYIILFTDIMHYAKKRGTYDEDCHM